MNKFIIASCLIALTFGWAIGPSDYCSCKEYLLETECKSAGCQWTTGSQPSCDSQKVNCTEILSIYCSLNYQCYMDGDGTCKTFSSCSDLKGTTDAQCSVQNSQCGQPSENGTTCVKFQCSNYQASNCPTKRGCYLNGQTCSNALDCSTASIYKCSLPFCSWNGQTCSQAICGNYTIGGDGLCTGVYESGTRILQPCIWNYTANNCNSASGPEKLNATTCQKNTGYRYHWSSSQETDGSCIQCQGYGVILQILFVILLFLA